jgi:hypothetical protein
MPEPQTTHLDYAEEAEATEQAKAWPQAAALWLRACETCSDVERALGHVRHSSTVGSTSSTSTSSRPGKSSWPCGPPARAAGPPGSNPFVSPFQRGAMR